MIPVAFLVLTIVFPCHWRGINCRTARHWINGGNWSHACTHACTNMWKQRWWLSASRFNEINHMLSEFSLSMKNTFFIWIMKSSLKKLIALFVSLLSWLHHLVTSTDFRTAETLPIFCHRLKTHLFKLQLSPWKKKNDKPNKSQSLVSVVQPLKAVALIIIFILCTQMILALGGLYLQCWM